MKRLMVVAAAAFAVAAAGCKSVKVKTPEWEASAWSTWLKEDIDEIAVTRAADGYTVNINGVKRDVSERLPETIEATGSFVGNVVGTALTQFVAARGEAKAKVIDAKAKLKALCDDGSCGEAECSTCAR